MRAIWAVIVHALTTVTATVPTAVRLTAMAVRRLAEAAVLLVDAQ